MTQKTMVGKEVGQETLHNGGPNIEEKDSNKWYTIYPHSSSRGAKRLSTDISMTSRVTMDSKEPTVHSDRCTIGKA